MLHLLLQLLLLQLLLLQLLLLQLLLLQLLLLLGDLLLCAFCLYWGNRCGAFECVLLLGERLLLTIELRKDLYFKSLPCTFSSSCM